MAVVAGSSIELVSSEPIEGLEMILDSESVSMSSSELSSSESDPQLQTNNDMDISPSKEVESDESLLTNNIKNNCVSLSERKSENSSNAPTPESATTAQVTDVNIDSCDIPIETCDTDLETSSSITPKPINEVGSVEEANEGPVVEVPDDDDDPTIIDLPDTGSAPEIIIDEDDDIKVIETVVDISPSKKESSDEDSVKVKEVKDEVKTERDEKPEVKTKTPSVTLVLESKLEDVEDKIKRVIDSAQTNDLTSTDIKTELEEDIRTLTKTELETLIMGKIIEAITFHSNVGNLSQKLIQSNTQRDRLFHKISNLQRQVNELSKAVRSVSENVGRNQKPLNKANQPIRFYRSVGVQVVMEGTVVNTPRKSVPVQGEMAKSILKSGNNNNSNALQITTSTIMTARPLKPLVNNVTTALPVGVQVGNVNPNLKRPLKSTITVAEVNRLAELQSQAQNKIRRVSTSPAASVGTSTGLMNGGTKITTATTPTSVALSRQPPALHQIRNPAAAAATKALNAMAPKTVDLGVVDLTDDETPNRTALVPASSSLMVNTSPGNVVLAPNGVQQYRLISQGQQFQFIQAGKSYQIVTSGSQTRPPANIQFVSPANIQQTRPMQQIRPSSSSSSPLLLRQMTNVISAQTTTTPISINGQLLMRPVVPRPPTNTVSPMMAKQSYSIVTRPGITVTPTNPNSSKVTYSNGVAANRITSTQYRAAAPQVTRMVTRPAIDSAAKKFTLPPLPPPAITGNPRRCSKDIPPRPELTLVEQNEGIVLSWTLKLGSNHAEIQTYQIYACQEPLFNSQKSAAWKRVGDVKALPLPMACTLSQFTDENRYHFIVRGVDVYNRTGPFCEASAIKLMKKS